MKKFIKTLSESIINYLLPRNIGEDQIIKKIDNSLKKLDYYGVKYDKKNIKKDISFFYSDFNRVAKETFSYIKSK
mgnify:FL=1